MKVEELVIKQADGHEGVCRPVVLSIETEILSRMRFLKSLLLSILVTLAYFYEIQGGLFYSSNSGVIFYKS